MRKKITSILKLAVCLLALNGYAQETPLSFGVISDIHFGNSVGEGPMVKVPQALKNLTSQGSLDALAVVGDLTDGGRASEYEQLVEVFQDQANFSKPVGEFLFMMGNHDNIAGDGKSNYQEGLKAFNNGEPYPFHIYKVIKGYPFITLSEFSSDAQDWGSESSGWNAYPEDNQKLLEEYLDKASKECPGKPIFVFTHVPPRWTVYGTWPELENGSTWAMKVLNPILNKYPQAVVFAGHSHYPLGDPRSIHQGVNPDSPRQNYFTSINTASTTYSEIHPGAVDEGYHPAGYTNVTEGLILTELPNGDIEIRRYDTYRNLEIGASDRWVLKAPFDGSQFQYGDIRDADDNPNNRTLRDGAPAPAFPEGAQITSDMAAYSGKITFPQATDNDCVFRYRIRITENGLVLSEQFLFSQFYLNTAMPESLTITAAGLKPETEYKVEVVAYDSYDNLSAPLESTFTTSALVPGKIAPTPEGTWDFEDENNLLKNSTGTFALIPVLQGSNSVSLYETFEESGIIPAEGPSAEDKAILLPSKTGLMVERNTETTSEFTLMMNILVKDAASYNSLWQTNINNSNDADLFYHQNTIGVGDMGYYERINEDVWHRVTITNHAGRVKVYVDGVCLINVASAPRWVIDPECFYFLCDNDNERVDTWVSELMFWELPLSENEIRAFSGLDPVDDETEPYLNVETNEVRLLNESKFSITVDANVPFTFNLPDWIVGDDVVPFNGKKTYTFHTTEMESGSRSDYITVEADGMDPGVVYVEQNILEDELPDPIGWWNFDNVNNLLEGIGASTLTAAYAGAEGIEKTNDLASVGLESVEGPTEDNLAIRVPADTYLWLTANAGVDVLTSFSLMMDVKVPDVIGYKALFQNDVTNKEDAGLFIKNNTIGRGGSSNNLGYNGNIDAEVWYRILMTVKNKVATVYVNGTKISQSPTANDAWTILNDALLFADNDGEVGLLDVADIKLWNMTFGDKEAELLGNPYSDVDEVFVVQTASVRLVDKTSFAINVNSNVPFTFTLPDWIQAVDTEFVEGEKDYTFSVTPMSESARREGIVVVEADGFDPVEVVVTQIHVGAELPESIGWWTFDNAEDLMAGTGIASLSAAHKGENGPEKTEDLASVGIEPIEGPTASNGAISVGFDTYLWLSNNLGIGEMQDFSIMFDIKPWSIVDIGSLYQSDITNKADAGLFTKKGMVGLNSYGLGYAGNLEWLRWHRVTIVVKGGYMHLYMDGYKVNSSTSSASVWSLFPDVLLFADNDGEEIDMEVSEIRLWDVCLTDDHIRELGAVEQEWEEEPIPEPAGVWTFDDPQNILAGTGVATLAPAMKGSPTPIDMETPEAAGIVSVKGISETNLAATVPLNSYLKMTHNQESPTQDSYTLLMDIKPKLLQGYNVIYQTGLDNNNDGELFIKDTQIGINTSGLGYSGKIVQDQWHRIGVVVAGSLLSVYVDGIRVSVANEANTRWTMDDHVFIFCDEDGEEGPVDIAHLCYYNEALAPYNMQRLGWAGLPTSIEAVSYGDPLVKSYKGIYDLMGRRLDGKQLQKGIYIINGKKMLVK